MNKLTKIALALGVFAFTVQPALCGVGESIQQQVGNNEQGAESGVDPDLDTMAKAITYNQQIADAVAVNWGLYFLYNSITIPQEGVGSEDN